MSRILVDGEPINYDGLPVECRDIVRLYMERGCDPGSGWTAILENNLSAVVKCYNATVVQLPQIYRWLVNHAPYGSWGSPEAVRDWMRKRRAAA